jgi:hypothetical protein
MTAPRDQLACFSMSLDGYVIEGDDVRLIPSDFDRLEVRIVPVILGRGRRAFREHLSRVNLIFVDAHPDTSGCIQIVYVREETR